MSIASASSLPPPRARPSITAIVAFGIVLNLSAIAWKVEARSVVAAARGAVGGSGSRRHARWRTRGSRCRSRRPGRPDRPRLRGLAGGRGRGWAWLELPDDVAYRTRIVVTIARQVRAVARRRLICARRRALRRGARRVAPYALAGSCRNPGCPRQMTIFCVAGQVSAASRPGRSGNERWPRGGRM